MVFSSDFYEAFESQDYSRLVDLLGKIKTDSLSSCQKWIYLQTYKFILDQMGITHPIQLNKVSFEKIQWDLILISLKKEIDSKKGQEPAEKVSMHESYNDIWATYNGC